MSELIKIQYTDPNNGFERVEGVTLDVAKYRKDESGLPAENFFFNASALNTESSREIADIVESSIVANPYNPYACSVRNVVYGLVKYRPSGTSLTLTKNPQTLGFTTGVPIAIIRNFDDLSPVCYITPTGVTTTTLDFASSLVSLNIKENYIAIVPQIPSSLAGSFQKENKGWGIKSLLERPAAPTLDANVENGVIKVTLTEPTNAAFVIKKYCVFVVSNTSEIFDVLYPKINGNRKPDLVLNPGDLLNKPVTTWGGGVDANGGTVTTGTYYVVAIAKDIDTDMACNVSYLSNIETVTV